MFVECPLNEDKIINMGLIQLVTTSGQTDLKRFYIDFYTKGDGEENYHWVYERGVVRDEVFEKLKNYLGVKVL